jgi:hypothetical protein
LNFFRDLEHDRVSGINIEIFEGGHPGSTYYAAELMMDPEEANAMAESEDIPLRFRRVSCHHHHNAIECQALILN